MQIYEWRLQKFTLQYEFQKHIGTVIIKSHLRKHLDQILTMHVCDQQNELHVMQWFYEPWFTRITNTVEPLYNTVHYRRY